MKKEEVKQLAKAIDADLLETHTSYILLTNKYAFKIKKEIQTSFLDYSTKNRRKRMCQQELLLNKDLTKGIYLSVEEIKVSETGIMIGNGNGKTIEYCVKMKKLDQGKQLNFLIEMNLAKNNSIKKLAGVVARFHLHARKSKLKKYSLLWIQFNDLFIEIRKSNIYSSIELSKIKKKFDYIHQFLISNKQKFLERESYGYIKDVHGDLHTGNVFIYATPIVFDRIEFSEKFRMIDVLQEVAFMCMDFEVHGRNDLSQLFLNYYLKKSKVEMDEVVFLFYKCYSANVRAKVNLLSYRESGKKKYLKEFQKYYILMVKYINEIIMSIL